MTVTVIIPWWAGSDEDRVRARTVVQEYYEEWCSWQVRVASVYGDTYSVSQAMNEGIHATTSDIVVRNDGDSIVAPEMLVKAVQAAEEAPGLVYAYTRFRRLTEAGTRRLANNWAYLFNPTPADVMWEQDGAPAPSVSAIRRECLTEIGPFDEGFVGWGYEDLELVEKAAALWPLRRIPGDLIHMWHEPAEGNDPEQDERNRQRWLSLGGPLARVPWCI